MHYAMIYLSLAVLIFGGCFLTVAGADPAWCIGYKQYCTYNSIKTQCPTLCNVTDLVDPSWCSYYSSYCRDNPSIRAQCPRTCDVAINGNWGHWSEFGPCSVTCGHGKQARTRLCNRPAPEHGGLACALVKGHGMSETETKLCHKDLCPIHGGYSAWSAFSKCTKSCGAGMQYRNRCCTSPFPSHGGDDCSVLGSPVDARVCNAMPCPIHGNYSKWTDFGPCSKICGGGVHTKVRSCSNPVPLHGGHNCSTLGPAILTEPCNKHHCPVHGGYTDWSPYSKCSQDCGSGLQYRSRCCVHPVPAYGGENCEKLGEPVQMKVCNPQPCPVHGQWSAWEGFGVCTRPCGSDGVKMRKRACSNPAPLFNGKDCEGSGFDTVNCNRIECSVDGGFTAWSAWTNCSVMCGTGVQESRRTCTSPAPSGGGRPCNGSTLQTKSCAKKPCPVNGNWSAWEAYGPCSAVCGENGVKLRRRLCNNPPPMFNGKDCGGSGIESAACNRIPCKVDGGVTNWSEWGPCSATCGSGISLKTRTCTNPSPANGGKVCSEAMVESQKCNIKSCPVYKYGLELQSWDDAEKICVNWGGHLASVVDQAEMDVILNGLSKSGVSLADNVYVWIGLQDKVITNKWNWIDGTVKNAFTPWGNGEPNHDDHHCVCMNVQSKTWWDRNCLTLYRYVCKK